MLFWVVLLLVLSDLFLILKANVVKDCLSGPWQPTLLMKKMLSVPLSLQKWVSGPNLLDMLTWLKRTMFRMQVKWLTSNFTFFCLMIMCENEMLSMHTDLFDQIFVDIFIWIFFFWVLSSLMFLCKLEKKVFSSAPRLQCMYCSLGSCS